MGVLQISLLICALKVAIVAPTGNTGIVPSSETHRHQDGHGNYDFGYSVHDGLSSQFRHESRDSHGKVTGTYGLSEIDGRKRVVDYVADHYGFRANVRTNEPGTGAISSASSTVEKFETAPVGPDHSHFHRIHPIIRPSTKDVLHPSGSHSASAIDQSKWGYHPAFGSRIPSVKGAVSPPLQSSPLQPPPLPPPPPPRPNPVYRGPVSLTPPRPINEHPNLAISRIPSPGVLPSDHANVPIGNIPSPGVLPPSIPQDGDLSQSSIDPNQLLGSISNIAGIPYHGTQNQYNPYANPSGPYAPGGSVQTSGRPYDSPSYSTNSLYNPNQVPTTSHGGYPVRKPAIQGIAYNPMNPSQYHYVTNQNNYANRPTFAGYPYQSTGSHTSSNYPYLSNSGFSRPQFSGFSSSQPVYPYHSPQGYPIKPPTYNRIPSDQRYPNSGSQDDSIKFSSPGRTALDHNFPYHELSGRPQSQIPDHISGHHHYTNYGNPSETQRPILPPGQSGYRNHGLGNELVPGQIPNVAESGSPNRPNVILRAVPIPNGIQAVPVDANTGEVLTDYPGFNVNNGHPIASGSSNVNSYPSRDLSHSASTETKTVADPDEEEDNKER